MSEIACRRLLIQGRVQGVGFRYGFHHEAVRLGLVGWVRNRPDGTVEAVVSGTAGAVEAIVAWSRHGPPSSQVDCVTQSPDEGRFGAFEIRSTG